MGARSRLGCGALRGPARGRALCAPSRLTVPVNARLRCLAGSSLVCPQRGPGTMVSGSGGSSPPASALRVESRPGWARRRLLRLGCGVWRRRRVVGPRRGLWATPTRVGIGALLCYRGYQKALTERLGLSMGCRAGFRVLLSVKQNDDA